MTFRKPKTTSEWIAVILVPAVSILNIGFIWFFNWDYSFIISFVGICYPIAFLLNFKIYEILLFVFAFSQLISLEFVLDGRVFNLAQVVNIHIGFTFNRSFYLGLGVPGIFLVALAVRVRMDSIFGSRIHLFPFKKDSLLTEFLPADVEIIKRMKIGDETSWYLVRFLNTEKETCAMIRGKDDYLIKPGSNQIVEFWMVEDPQWFIHSKVIERKLLRKPGWAVVK